MWFVLRNRNFRGMKFLRQHPIKCEIIGRQHFFIANFYCAEKKLVIELDGKIHDYQKDHDAERDLIMRNLGLKILRIKNEELDEMEQIKSKIESALLEEFTFPSLLLVGGAEG